ncbi:hypothetical protein B0H65DRAFT_480671 [Neurospora tetraspora]|uniref:Uncharacterized protein n=1 Tax=Neurospora tetraspora TaxID=94610 RepID=A0AAE0J165_9PEZI|nr:hypothetical protein B0H65DRAFT_480671 [Neurospora tetraspora]
MSSSENKNQQQDLNALAEEAERDLNTWYAKTGHRRAGIEEEAPGINELEASRKFPGTEIRYGEDLCTNKSWDKKIPEPEGGDRDDKGHLLHGHAYEGIGGPEDKTAHIYQHSPGRIDEEVVKGWGLDPVKLTEETFDPSRPDLLPPDQARGHGYDNTEGGPHKYQQSILESGKRAAAANVFGEDTGLGLHHRDLPTGARGGNKWRRGSKWEAREGVPDQGADMNEVPPKSVVEFSHSLH